MFLSLDRPEWSSRFDRHAVRRKAGIRCAPTLGGRVISNLDWSDNDCAQNESRVLSATDANLRQANPGRSGSPKPLTEKVCRRPMDHTTRERPEKSRIMRMTRLNVTSLTLRNIRMPSVVPAASAVKLTAKSIAIFVDRPLRERISPRAQICIAAMNG